MRLKFSHIFFLGSLVILLSACGPQRAVQQTDYDDVYAGRNEILPKEVLTPPSEVEAKERIDEQDSPADYQEERYEEEKYDEEDQYNDREEYEDQGRVESRERRREAERQHRRQRDRNFDNAIWFIGALVEIALDVVLYIFIFN